MRHFKAAAVVLGSLLMGGAPGRAADLSATEWTDLAAQITDAQTNLPIFSRPALASAAATLQQSQDDSGDDRPFGDLRPFSATTKRADAPSVTEVGVLAGSELGTLLGRGMAAWYQHAGKTASGEIFRPDKLTAAHATLPLGTRVRVVNQRNHKSVVVNVNDRMTTQRSIRRRFTIELSRGGAQALGIDGIAPVAIYQIGSADHAEIAGAEPQSAE